MKHFNSLAIFVDNFISHFKLLNVFKARNYAFRSFSLFKFSCQENLLGWSWWIIMAKKWCSIYTYSGFRWTSHVTFNHCMSKCACIFKFGLNTFSINCVITNFVVHVNWWNCTLSRPSTIHQYFKCLLKPTQHYLIPGRQAHFSICIV